MLQVALVYGQMNEPPGARARVALTGLTVAEYFRDKEGKDVLLFIDNIFRFTQAGSEVRGRVGSFWNTFLFNQTHTRTDCQVLLLEVSLD